MESMLSDVNAVVGVTGSFVANRKGKILARALPSVYDAGLLETVALAMMQTFTGVETYAGGRWATSTCCSPRAVWS
jgi:predicted regulator of Ras-like GTPase activity (Roadblock/LC7/MglB family)